MGRSGRWLLEKIIEEMERDGGRGLSLEIVAERYRRRRGGICCIDYGRKWEAAWDQHLNECDWIREPWEDMSAEQSHVQRLISARIRPWRDPSIGAVLPSNQTSNKDGDAQEESYTVRIGQSMGKEESSCIITNYPRRSIRHFYQPQIKVICNPMPSVIILNL